jgi:hypothetical protein
MLFDQENKAWAELYRRRKPMLPLYFIKVRIFSKGAKYKDTLLLYLDKSGL